VVKHFKFIYTHLQLLAGIHPPFSVVLHELDWESHDLKRAQIGYRKLSFNFIENPTVKDKKRPSHV